MILITALTFFSVALVLLAVLSIPLSSRTKVKRSLRELAAYDTAVVPEDTEPEAAPFADRIVWPLVRRIGETAGNMSDKKRLAKVNDKLALAGVRRLDAPRFISIKLALGGAAAVIFLLVTLPWAVWSGRPWWLGLLLIPISYWSPDFWLNRLTERRQHAIAVSLADTIDLLKIGIEAGLTFDAAVAKIAKNSDGPLSEELGRVLGEMQIGVSRRDALKAMGERTTVQELHSFCTTFIQADNLGISVGKILRNEATEIREKRRQVAEEQAMKLPVKLVFPIVLCIMPALMIVVIGPGIVRISTSLFGGN